MAKANTFKMESGGFFFDPKKGCAICGAEASHRGFFYPTYMNGDAEWCGDYCDEHKGTNLQKVCKGEIKIRYKID